MEYSIDFSEPIPKMVQRLKAEHREFRLQLIQIEEVSDFSWQKAIEMLKKIRKPILRRAVEEEARIVRVIMQKAKDESEESINAMQEHRGIIEFLDKRIPQVWVILLYARIQRIMVLVSKQHYQSVKEAAVSYLLLFTH